MRLTTGIRLTTYLIKLDVEVQPSDDDDDDEGRLRQ